MNTRREPIAAIGALMLANGLVIGSPWIISEFMSSTEVTFLDTVGDWRYVAFNYVYLVATIAIVAVAPTLRGWLGKDGQRLPDWIIPILAVGAALQACTLFTQAVVSPFLLGIAPEALTTQDGGLFAILMSAIWIIWIATLCLLATVAWRRKVFPAAAAIVMIVGALVIPIFGPIGSVLVGGALLWSGLTGRRAATAQPAVVPV